MNPISIPGPGGRCRRRAVGEQGMSLVGMLLTLVILGGMAAIAVHALGGDSTDPTGTGIPSALAPGLLPASGGDPVAEGGASAGAGPGGPAALAHSASPAVCMQDAATLESAMSAASVTGGTFPTTLAELVAKGFLSELPDAPGYTFAPEVVGGRATGKILVNGLPARTGGCQTPTTSAR